MSDQGLVWKAAFGALVLVFCAATYLSRKAPNAPAPVHEPVDMKAPALPPALQASEPAPLDVQEEPQPVRVEVTFSEPEPALRAQNPSRLGPAPQPVHVAKTPSPRLHSVSTRRKAASPYAIGRKHYPIDPKQRWPSRDAP